MKKSIKLKLNTDLLSKVFRLNRFFRLAGWPAWVSLALWLLISAITVLSFQLVNWTTPQPSYILILALSVVLAMINIKLNKSIWLTAFICLAVGIIVTIWQSVGLFKAPNNYGLFRAIGFSFNEWSKVLQQTSPNENNIYFSLFLIIITWFWGYIGTWRLLKKNSVWPTLLFGLIIVLVNLSFLNKSYFGYFYLYIFLSIVLISYSHFIKQNYSNGLFPKLSAHIPIWIAVLVVTFGGILLLVIRVAPEIKSDQLRTLYEVKLKQSNAIEKLKINIFSSVGSKGVVVKNAEQDVLRFSSHPTLSDDVQFKITSSGVPNYWRDRRYDTYNQWGWSNSPYNSIIVPSGDSQALNVTPADHYNIIFTVMNKIKTDVVLSSGKYLYSNAPNIIHFYDSLNPDVKASPDDNLVSVSSPHIYQVDDTYNVISEIIKPTVDQLKAASQVYPSWITGQYLQLPSTLPASIIRQASATVRGSATEYDKVTAINTYLSKFKYILEGTYPPENKDGVDDFLFIQGAGNCTNFASAAVVLMRSVGIPARFCTGYIPHYVDKNSDTFVVLAKDFHAWPEVYFPGYGWIEFEVTPGSVPSDITGDTTGNNLSGLSGSDIQDFPLYPPAPRTPAPQSPNPSRPAGEEPQGSSSGTRTVLILVFIAALISLAIVWRVKMKRHDAISEVMARLHLVSPLIGVPFRSSQTAQEYADYLSARLPNHNQEINKLTQIYMVSRYSRGKLIILQDENLLTRYWHSIFWGMIKRTLFRR